MFAERVYDNGEEGQYFIDHHHHHHRRRSSWSVLFLCGVLPLRALGAAKSWRETYPFLAGDADLAADRRMA
jgi:hypothetical protein